MKNHDYEPGENSHAMETEPLCRLCNGSKRDHDPNAGAVSVLDAERRIKAAKKSKKLSRQDRWQKACGEAKQALEQAIEALNALQDVHQEYQDWRDNLPENLHGAAVGEKLDTVCDFDVSGTLGDVETIRDSVEEAESFDLPQGFGRD